MGHFGRLFIYLADVKLNEPGRHNVRKVDVLFVGKAGKAIQAAYSDYTT